MLRALFLVLLGFSVALSSSSRFSEIPKPFRDGYFLGRSDNILIADTTAQLPKSQMAIIGSQYLDDDSLPSALSINTVSDIISRSFGILAPSDQHRTPDESHGFDASFLRTGLFKRPQANIFIGIESLALDEITSEVAPNLASSFADPLAVTDLSAPFDAVAASVSLATGSPPSVHAVVGSTWVNSEGVSVSAFSDDLTSSQVANVADILTQTFQGSSLAVSVSANRQLAAAFCPHTSLRKSHPLWSNVCGSYDAEKRSFGDALRPDWPHRSHSQIVSEFDSHGLWSSLSRDATLLIKYVAASSTFEVSMNGQVIRFDVKHESDFALFAELQYMTDVIQLLESMNGIHDDTPDMFSFSIASLAGIAQHYGQSSSHFKAATRVVDAAVANMLARISALYNGRVLTEILLWGRVSTTLRSQETLQGEQAILSAILSQHSLGDVARSLVWPTASISIPLRLHPQPTEFSMVCADLRVALSGYEYLVLCPTTAMSELSALELSSYLSSARLRGVALASTSATYSSSPPTDDQVQQYQIALWFSIGFALTLIAVAYSVCCMEFKRDTLLYSRFNPNVKHRAA